MSLSYIRKRYKVPARRGGRVIYSGGKKPVGGRITSASGTYVAIVLDGESKPKLFHPTWKLKYLADNNAGDQP